MLRVAAFVFLTAGLLGPVAAQDKKKEVDELVKLLKSKKAAERIQAVDKLAGLGADAKDAAGPVIESMLDGFPSNLRNHLNCIEKIRPRLHPYLVTVTVDNDHKNVSDAVFFLGKLGKEAEPAMPLLHSIYQGTRLRQQWSGTDTVTEAFHAILRIAPSQKSTTNMALAAITGRNPALRQIALGMIDKKELVIDTKLLVPALVSAPVDGEERLAIINRLANMGADAAAAVPALEELKLDGNKKVRDAAAAAIEKIKK